MNHSKKKYRLKLRGADWGEHFLTPMLIGFVTGYVFAFLFLNLIEYQRYTFPICISFAMSIALVTYFIQLKKLQFKTLKTSREMPLVKVEITEFLKTEGWDIDHDTQKFLQASYRRSFLSVSMLTIRFLTDEIQWNVIEHPHWMNPTGSLFSPHIKAKRMISRIKDVVK
jgi:hypothetical protein